MESDYKVHNVMTRKVATLEIYSSIIDIAKLMEKNKIGSVVIVEKGKPVGIITEQDIVRKVVAYNRDANNLKAREVMSGKLVTVSSDSSLYDVVVKMGESGIKHLPVVDKEKLVGIITAKDVIRVEPTYIEKLVFKSSLTDDEVKNMFN